MKVRITARRFKLKDELREYIEKKCTKLVRFFDGIVDCEVILGWEKTMRYAEIKAGVHSKQIITKEVTEDMRKSFDQAYEKMERQLKNYKEILRSKDKDQVHSA